MSEPSLQPVDTEGDGLPLPPAPDAVSVDLSQAEGLPRAVQRKLWAASLFAAFIAHALFALGLGWVPGLRAVGAGGIELEAIDIDLVSSKVLESRLATSQAATAPPDALDHAAPGATVAAEASAATADQKPSQSSEARPQPAGPTPDLVIPDAKEEEPPPEPAEVALAIAETRPEDPDDRQPESEPQRAREPDTEAAPPSRPSEASEAADVGGAAARGIEGIEVPSQQAAAASPGAASEYAKAVIETLASSKPRARAGMRGTVRISFTVARTGEVSEARVLASSGRRVLDEAALSAVRTAKFPAPPPTLANAQLNYEVPYIFR